MKLKAVLAGLAAILIFTFCGCGLQTTMDMEYLQEEAFRKGYEQGLAEAELSDNYNEGYSKGYEEGYSAGYSAGSTASENIEDSEKPEENETAVKPDNAEYDYVLNTNSMKFHKPDCESVGDIKEKNKDFFMGTRDEIMAKGYEPCGRCGP